MSQILASCLTISRLLNKGGFIVGDFDDENGTYRTMHCLVDKVFEQPVVTWGSLVRWPQQRVLILSDGYMGCCGSQNEINKVAKLHNQWITNFYGNGESEFQEHLDTDV